MLTPAPTPFLDTGTDSTPALVDIEAYAKTGDHEAVLALLATVIGPMVNVETPPDEDHYLQTYTSGAILAVVQEKDDGFLSVWLKGACPWLSSPALGRFLSAHLQCLVRCDPGADYPEIPSYSDVFLQIEGNVESLITWE